MSKPKPISNQLAKEMIKHIDMDGLKYEVIQLNDQYFDVTNSSKQEILALIENNRKANPTHTTKEES